MSYSKNLHNDVFSHIYIERAIRKHPNTIEILEKIKPKNIIEIESYGQIFNRHNQSFKAQKKSMQLILAKKYVDFYYPGSKHCENYNCKFFYYTSNVYNCLYDCSYCYLKSIYPCGHMVIFVNIEDFLYVVEKDLLSDNPMLAISYDSDLLAFSPIFDFITPWFDLLKKHPKFTIEVKTKSGYFPYKQVPENMIFAWSILPEEMISAYESRVPSFHKRIKAMQKAIAQGVKIRLSIEPLMPLPDIETTYDRFVRSLTENLDPNSIYDCNVGSFRISPKQFKMFCKRDPESMVFAHSFIKNNTCVAYPSDLIRQNYLEEKLRCWLTPQKVYAYTT